MILILISILDIDLSRFQQTSILSISIDTCSYTSSLCMCNAECGATVFVFLQANKPHLPLNFTKFYLSTHVFTDLPPCKPLEKVQFINATTSTSESPSNSGGAWSWRDHDMDTRHLRRTKSKGSVDSSSPLQVK